MAKTTWVLLGSTGQLGNAMRTLLEDVRSFDEVYCPTREELDLANAPQMEDYILKSRPSVVVNCAAWTDVDGAEVHRSDAFRVNGEGPLALARILARQQLGLLIQISTDYVFDGRLRRPYAECAMPSPLSVYGQSKVLGERVIGVAPRHAMVVRTAGLYSRNRSNFVTAILHKCRESEMVHVVQDLAGHPTYARDASIRVFDLALRVLEGVVRPGHVFHAVNAGVTTRYELAREIVRLTGGDPRRIVAISSGQETTRARRPPRVELGDEDARRLGIGALRPWRDALREFVVAG